MTSPMSQLAEGKRFQGHLNGEGLKIAVVAGRFNSFISNSLMSGCMDGLLRHGVAAEDVDVAWAPGAFEIPLVARKLAETKRYDAIIAIGAVIRGATPHFDYVCAENAKGIASVGHDAGIPVIYGVVTTDTIEQAIERAGTKAGNKGWDAATAAIEMANLLKSIADA